MVTKVYAHILDEDRKVNAQKFESAFYANPDLRGVQAPAEPAPALDVQSPAVTAEGNVITISYDSLKVRDYAVDMAMTLKVILEDDKVRFASELSNNEAHTVIRELHYPLVHGAVLPADHKLYTAEAGGRLYAEPQKVLSKLESSPYKKPEQFFRQKNVKYGAKVFMNCFALLGENQGLYFGSHDPSFQDTWHGLRAYKGKNGKFDCLELRNMSPYQSVLTSASEAMYASCAALSPFIPAKSPTPARICPTMPTIG